ncbi:peptidoglycan recognition protein 4-like isoform X1 [Macrosteles quadrilineatus]|uniref:peptidoglycan recognition protein 4-like isoform X1 n=1 Tax=Macrosteles quadrilineatus TaxID=74068 RepID=UPI0023E1DDF7|nr:peptidoglycan recognition protein 4-like isoform X1 [Macrosteles quadrilineatus]
MENTTSDGQPTGTYPRSKGVVEIVSRTLWDSLPPRKAEALPGQRLVVWFSDTATPECKNFTDCMSTVQELQIQHMDVLRLPDIKHNFLIGGDGRVYEGRGFGVKPSNDEYIKKMYPLVEDTLDIAYITTLEKGDVPSEIMREATINFLKYSKYQGHLTLVVHHEVWEWEHTARDILPFMKPDYQPSNSYEREISASKRL